MDKIKELEAMQKKRAELKSQKQSTISSSTDFLTTIYIGNKLGDTYNTRVRGKGSHQLETHLQRNELGNTW